MPRRPSVFALLSSTVMLIACGTDEPSPATIKVGACDGTQTRVEDELGVHVPIGSAIEWSTNPPVTGPHFPIWAAWDREYTELPRGHYVHNLEHGGIVLAYNCPDGCPDVVEKLRTIVREFDADVLCNAPVRNRFVVTGDPLLPAGVQVAALSWDAMWTGGCFDPYVRTFAGTHYRRAPEDLCVDGANLGGTLIVP
ncbi:MAG: DUF3105 domain-containing protein [Deltaproteobacteria bacterium]|nr:DUF3105 domain-containing protein [Deltaproteobacteria bacterium]